MNPSNQAERHIAAVVLAAGASSRLGQPKQLVRVSSESLLRRTARLAAEAGCAPVIVVLGFEAERMRPELEGLATTAIVHPGWAEGMGSSLRCGIEAVRRIDPLPDGVLLLVCDQPRLSLEHLRTLLRENQPGHLPITASVYARKMGVPAIFARPLFEELARLGGDQGARHLIRSHVGQTKGIPWPDGGVDLDAPQDLRAVE